MSRQFPETSLSRRWMFVLDCRTIKNASRATENVGFPAVTRIQQRCLPLPRSFFLGSPLVSKQVKTPVTTTLCSRRNTPANDVRLTSLEQPNVPQRDIRLYQTWRNPTWLHHSQLRAARVNTTRKAHRYQPFKGVRDAMSRLSCLALVFSGLGALHYLYKTVDCLAREQIQVASAQLGSEISIGRVVRCNPVTGIRIKRVSVSKPLSKTRTPFGSASYVDASVSGFYGMLLRRRPLELNVGVNRASVIVPNIVANEYEKEKLEAPKLEQPLRMLAGEWRQLPMWASLEFPKLLKPGSISFHNSRLRLECTQHSAVGQSAHVVEVVNMSGRVDLANPAQHTVARRTQEENGNMIFVKGNFRGGGSAHVALSPSWDRDASAPSMTAILTCCKVNLGSIASFLSLPFKLVDGYCTGSVEMELSPHVNAIPTMKGQAEVKSLGLRFDPDLENPQLRNLTGKVRFKERSLVLDQVEGALGTIPLEAEGHIDFVDGFKVVSHARPFDVNRIIDTFSLDRFIPVAGSVIGKAVVRGALNEPFVSGWIKAVGTRARADRVLLKSAEMKYDWDAAAGNLLFPSVKATIVGGGEVTGSGGIYFDMTKETPYGSWNEEHHVRNPKAQYWNSDTIVEKPVPPLPADDFELDRWAPFRPYDSLQFKIKGSGVSGGNLLRWYGRKFGAMATEAIGQISGSCHIAGHVDDANSRLVWRSVREGPPRDSDENYAATVPSNQASNETEPINDIYATHPSSKRQPTNSDPQGAGSSSNITNTFPPREETVSQEQVDTEYLGGLVYMKLGDLPEARRVKVRTVFRDFHFKRLFEGDPDIRTALLRAPNAVSSMDTLFKGIVCMRPSWQDGQPRSSGRVPLDLVSIDGALAVRKMSVNGVSFRSVISGSLSLSATDISLSLSEANSQRTSAIDAKLPLASDDRNNKVIRSRRPLDKLEVNVNGRGFLNMFMKWEDSEISASVAIDDKMCRIAELHAEKVDLQQLSGECNPLYEDEPIQGILSGSIRLDLTNQTGLVSATATDLALGPLHFGLATGQFALKEGEISMQEATLEQRLSKYKLDGKYVIRGEASDYECLLNINVDRAHIRDLARLFEGLKAIMESIPQKHEVGDQLVQEASWGFQPGSQFAVRDSSVTYWEVPEELSFSEQTKWYGQSLQKEPDTDLASILDSGVTRTDTPLRMYHTDNHLSGRVSVQYASRRHRDKRKHSALSSTDRGFQHVFNNTLLSFNFVGRNWILGKNNIELMTASGFLEDGSLSIGPFQIKGKDGLLVDGESRITNAGSLDGSINLRNAPVSNFDVFQNAGFDTRGNISGKFGMKGTVSNPTAYGQMLWQNATVNGRNVSQPHADLACSNGRCVINVDASVGGKGRRRDVDIGGADALVVVDAMDEALYDVETLNGKTEMRNVSSKRRKDVDSVRARVSVPVKLFVHQYILPRVPRGILPEHLGAIDIQVPFDDDWVYASVDVKRYGMVLLNAAVPKLGWIAGESDILIRVSGTQKNPEVEGTVKLKDGTMRPPWMTHPLHSLKGEMELRESGLISCKSLSGRCNGRGFSLRGGMFLSKSFEHRLEHKVRELEAVISQSKSSKKRRSRGVTGPLEEAGSSLRQGRSGMRIEAGGIPINVENVCSGIVSGKFLLTGSAMKPEIDGSLVFSEGVVSANSALADAGKGMRARSSRLVLNAASRSSSTEKSRAALKTPFAKLERNSDKNGSSQYDGENQPFGVHLKHLKVSLGRNVRVTHSFLFNVLVSGSMSFSGKPTNPSMAGKINILSGSVSALPARWAIRKSEHSYVSFVYDADSREEIQEPIIKLVLESDTIILRVSECAASAWMEHLSFSDKAGNRFSEGWWADAIHTNDDYKSSGRRIVNLLTSVMINTLVVGGEVGKYDWKVFPTYFGDALPKVSKSLSDKFGAGFQLDQGQFCFESNMFVDKSKGGQVMIKLSKFLNVHVFGDQSRRFASFVLTLPGKR